MSAHLKSAVHVAFERLGLRVFPKNRFYTRFLPYSQFGTEPIHHLRHFADVSGIEVCFDVGANKGQTAGYFSAVFPRARIYSFEPVTRTYATLVENTRQLPRVTPFHFAFGREPGAVEITLSADDQTNSLVAANGNGHAKPGERETIQVRTVDAFMAEHRIPRINLLKSDTEGFDLEVFKGAATAFAQRQIDFVYCEVAFERDDRLHTYFDDLLQFLAGHDFNFLGLFDTVYTDSPARLLHANALFGCRHSRLLHAWRD